MSAIWGVINRSENKMDTDVVKSAFKEAFDEVCIFDVYETDGQNQALMGCGVRFIRGDENKKGYVIWDAERKILFTADALIDNREELLVLLEIDKQSENQISDVELLYKLYLKMGTNGFGWARGLFSIAIWKQEEKTLQIISDPVASRCIYYAVDGDYISFSTIARPIRRIMGLQEPNLPYFKDLLVKGGSSYAVPGETAYEGLSLMKPCKVLTIKGGNITEEKYEVKGLSDYSGIKLSDPDVCGQTFLKVFRECVEDCLDTNWGIATALSGGFDSTSISALAAQRLAEQDRKLYSYTFVPAPDYKRIEDINNIEDESEAVKDMCRIYPNIEPQFAYGQGKNALEGSEEVMHILEMPIITPVNISHDEMYREANKKGCRVFLTGFYGNETISYGFSQNIWYDYFRHNQFVHMWKDIKRYCEHEKMKNFQSYCFYLKKFYRRWKENDGTLAKVRFSRFAGELRIDGYVPEKRFLNDIFLFEYLGFTDKQGYDRLLMEENVRMMLGVLTTKMGLEYGMIVRVPALDVRMLHFCKNIPYNMFAYRGEPRWLIRHNMASMLPNSVTSNWNIQGVQDADWFARLSRDWGEIKGRILQKAEKADERLLNKKEIMDIVKKYNPVKDGRGVVMMDMLKVMYLLLFLEDET